MRHRSVRESFVVVGCTLVRNWIAHELAMKSLARVGDATKSELALGCKNHPCNAEAQGVASRNVLILITHPRDVLPQILLLYVSRVSEHISKRT